MNSSVQSLTTATCRGVRPSESAICNSLAPPATSQQHHNIASFRGCCRKGWHACSHERNIYATAWRLLQHQRHIIIQRLLSQRLTNMSNNSIQIRNGQTDETTLSRQRNVVCVFSPFAFSSNLTVSTQSEVAAQCMHVLPSLSVMHWEWLCVRKFIWQSIEFTLNEKGKVLQLFSSSIPS